MTQGNVRIPKPEGPMPEPELRSEARYLTRTGLEVYVEGIQECIEAEPRVSLQYLATGKRFSFGLAKARHWLRGAIPMHDNVVRFTGAEALPAHLKPCPLKFELPETCPLSVPEEERPAFMARSALASMGWKFEAEGSRLTITKPGGAVSSWESRPSTNGSGLYDLGMAVAKGGQR